jgi:RNA polymerase sigma-70 factor (ECF subfamily)
MDALTALFEGFRCTGEAVDFGRFHAATAPRLRALARRQLRASQDVDDVVQTTYLRALEGRRAFDPSRPVLPWLCGILVHAASEMRRRTRPTISLEHPLDGSGQVLCPSAGPLMAAIESERDRSMQSRIAGLPSAYREVARLAIGAALPPSAIAARLRRSPSTVRTQLARAVALLRRELA